MIVTSGKSRCQVKNIDGVDYCMNVRTHSGYMKMKDVYSMFIPQANPYKNMTIDYDISIDTRSSIKGLSVLNYYVGEGDL